MHANQSTIVQLIEKQTIQLTFIVCVLGRFDKKKGWKNVKDKVLMF